MRNARASSLTARSRPLRRTRIRRRCGSATALNASDVVAARAIAPIYVHIGICQAPAARDVTRTGEGRSRRMRQMMYAKLGGWLPYVLPPPFGRRRDREIRLDKHATVPEGGRSSNA